jgi:glycosyltransferase involved in cell wall biosynthesis
MKIAMPISTYLPTVGGAEVGLHNIAKRLGERGHEPTIIVPYQILSKTRDLNLPYSVISVPPKVTGLIHRYPDFGTTLLARIFSLYQYKLKFDYWHCTMGFPYGISVVKFAQLMGLQNRYLIRCTGIDIQCSPEIPYGLRVDPKYNRFISKWYPRASRMVAISDTVEDEYRSLNISDSNIIRVPNGIDAKRLGKPVDRLAVRARLGISPDVTLLLAVGRNHPKKGYSVLLDAIAQFKAEGREDVHAMLVGKDLDELKPQIEQLGIHNQVHLVGQIALDMESGMPEIPSQELIDIYKAADIFAFPSLMETFGIVILEAMAAGLAVVTTDGPGCVDHIRHGVDGMIAKAGDVADFTDKLKQVMSNQELRERIRENAVAKVGEYDWDRVTDLYLEEYQRYQQV